MVFDTWRTLIALAVVYGLLAYSFVRSPMPSYAVKISLAILAGFGAVTFYLGYRYGLYRSSQR